MKIFYALIFVFISTSLFSQTAWYFGNGYKLDFTKSEPKLSLHWGDHWGDEGEVLCNYLDSTGNLKYYFFSNTIKNGTGTDLFNGSGIISNNTNAKGGMFLKIPETKDSVILLTSKKNSSNAGKLYQALIVNQNVVGKNIPIYNEVIEGITAVPHKNGKDFWVLSHSAKLDSKDFLAFLLNKKGLSTTPTISSLGMETKCFNNVCGDVQAIEVNSCGNKLAYLYLDRIQIFDFDNSSGIVSNLQKTIYAYADTSTSWMDMFYGMEFSPDGKYLYCTKTYLHEIYQIDLSTSKDTLFLNDISYLGKGGGGARIGEIELGPDGKLYFPYHYWDKGAIKILGRINSPNQNGNLCDLNFDYAKTESSQYYTSMGLPNNIKANTLNAGLINLMCDKGKYSLELLNVVSPNSSIFWQIDNNAVVIGNQFFNASKLSFGEHTIKASYLNYCGDTLSVFKKIKLENLFFSPIIQKDCALETMNITINNKNLNTIHWFSDEKGTKPLAHQSQLNLNKNLPDIIWIQTFSENVDSAGAKSFYQFGTNDSTKITVVDDVLFRSCEFNLFSYSNSSVKDSVIIKLLNGSKIIYIDTLIVGLGKTRVSPMIILKPGVYSFVINKNKYIRSSIDYNGNFHSGNPNVSISKKGVFGNFAFSSKPSEICNADTTIITASCITVSNTNTQISEFEIYPNPNTGNFVINNLNPEFTYRFQVIDSKGSLLYSANVQSQTIEVSLPNANNGIYFIVQTNLATGRSNSYKFIIQH